MQVTFLELEKWEENYLKEKFKDEKGAVFNFYGQVLDNKILKVIAGTEILACFIYSQINEKVFTALPKLKYITTMSTGFDHIDLTAAKKAGVRVSNVPSYGENTVAEHTWALILSLSRRMRESFEKTKNFNFSPQGLRGFDLKDKTLGIVGFGHIGEHVARMAKGFEMRVKVFDPVRDERRAKKLGVKYVSFEELLKTVDIISLHAPDNQQTHHMINMKNIALIKKGAYLINTARGGLVETGALVFAIKEGILAGAGLDVLEEESFIKEEKELLAKTFKKKSNLKTVLQDHWLMTDKRVAVTPHNAFNSGEALKRILDMTAENIQQFLKRKIINEVE